MPSGIHYLNDMSRTVTDPPVHHGHHFSRVVHVFCNLNVLVTNGLMCMSKLACEVDLKAVRVITKIHCYMLHHVLELCAWNRNPEVNKDDPKDQMTSISGCRSFTFSLADALELHGT